MKKILKSMLLLTLITFTGVLSSCGGNEEEEDHASAIIGTYIGEDYASETKMLSTKAIGASAVITRSGKNTVNIVYDNDGVTKAGTETQYKSAKVTKNDDGSYNFRSYDNSILETEAVGFINGNNINFTVLIEGALVTDFRGVKSVF